MCSASSVTFLSLYFWLNSEIQESSLNYHWLRLLMRTITFRSCVCASTFLFKRKKTWNTNSEKLALLLAYYLEKCEKPSEKVWRYFFPFHLHDLRKVKMYVLIFSKGTLCRFFHWFSSVITIFVDFPFWDIVEFIPAFWCFEGHPHYT